ncbi:glycoside hydrolase family 18 protein [Coniophora puteana RWD-64-598 SS2]|uniref:Glycoside hydrolase family 18 protein n=1 Tax=Coniophora puteana (strain RWD-64-598) TaxID=741705 RepID=A0A5M3MIC4_CONPW|nr:glycoside hydrolase family 18 protein [Coniophora puteana RWD-64-598 SS2]EIW78962.1 glycoside hydrolase family 18 protein [Coniophora puteana RWD-64-598 SS2]
MVAFTSVFTTIFAAVLSATSVNAAPVTQSLAARSAAPSAPHFVAYIDEWMTPPATTDLTGFNVVALSFWRPGAPVDEALEWQDLDAATRNSTLSTYSAAGIKTVVSAFGADYFPTSGSPELDPTQTADELAAWVIQYGFDGVDIDYEDYTAMNKKDGSAEQWLITFTTELRNKLPASDYFITHAPLAPWFSSSVYTSGGYIKVNQEVGSLIDWYNVQFYNDGTSEYTTCDGLINTSSTTYPDTALFQIVAAGVTADKLVIGKPGTTADETDGGYMSASDLASCLQQATAKNWNAGVSIWQYPDAGAAWIKTVRSLAFPE